MIISFLQTTKDTKNIQMDKKTPNVTTSHNNKNLTSNQATLTVDQLDIEILPIIYEIIRW